MGNLNDTHGKFHTKFCPDNNCKCCLVAGQNYSAVINDRDKDIEELQKSVEWLYERMSKEGKEEVEQFIRIKKRFPKLFENLEDAVKRQSRG